MTSTFGFKSRIAMAQFMTLWRGTSRLVACLALLAALAPVSASRAQAASCSTSGDCAPPLAYCHPGLLQCVECLGDGHCGGAKCDTVRGVCTQCLGDLDCGAFRPYCSAARKGCVECLTDKNCGTSGVTCLAGECGSCGDGICGPRETFQSFTYFEYCAADCADKCPGTDLGTVVGAAVASGSSVGGSNVALSNCGGVAGPEVTFKWTAPGDGYYTFDTAGSDFNTVLSVLAEGCASQEEACNANAVGVQQSGIQIYVPSGSSKIIVVDSAGTAGGNYVLNIKRPCGNGVLDSGEQCEATNLGGHSCASLFGDFYVGTLRCTSDCQYDMGLCTWGPPVTGAGGAPAGSGGVGGFGGMPAATGGMGGISDAGSNVASDAGQMLGGHCKCAECSDWERECHWDLGCVEILGCAVDKQCNDLGACYALDKCRAQIDSTGGLSARSAQVARDLLACMNGAGCDKRACSDDGWLEPCVLYCAIIGNVCVEESTQYPNAEDCIASCEALPRGRIYETANSLNCRYGQLRESSRDPQHCSVAGPAGVESAGAVSCGTPCEGYCSILLDACPDAYADTVECLVTCAEFPGTDVPIFHADDFDDGDTFQCRLKHALRAWRGEDGCDAAGPVSSGFCGPIKPGPDAGIDGGLRVPAIDAGAGGGDDSGCGCRTLGARGEGTNAGWMFLLLVGAATLRRHRRVHWRKRPISVLGTVHCSS